MNVSPMDLPRRSRLARITTAAAGAVGAANVVLSVLALLWRPAFLQVVATSDWAVSTKILAVLGLQCVAAHAVGRLVARVSRGRSWTAALPSLALLALVSAWIAVFNIQVLLAPSFTFTAGPVVMTNPYIAVILTYLGCAFVSFGFIFLNMRLARVGDGRPGAPGRLSGEEFSMVVSGVHSLFFVALGIMAGI